MRRAEFAPVVAAVAFAVFAVVVLFYWHARHGELVWDDLSYIGNAVYQDPALWREALFNPPTGNAVFRPLTLLSFALQQWAGQTTAAPFHVFSFILHGINAALVFLIAVVVLHDSADHGSVVTSAALAALVYGLHPALSESALWVAARFDLLMTMFLLVAVLTDRVLHSATAMRPLLVSALFLLALLSKETAVGFLVALPLFHLAVAPENSGRGAWRVLVATLAAHRRVYFALLMAFGVYLALRFAVQGPDMGMTRVFNRAADIGGLDQRVLIAMASMTEYISDALWLTTNIAPNRVLGIPIDDPIRISSSIATLAGGAVIAALAMRATPVRRTAALLFAAFAGALVPVCNILPAPTYAGELQIATRYLTFPLAFVALSLGVCCTGALTMLRARKFAMPAVCGGLIVAWFGASIYVINDNIPHWADRESFYKFAISQSPPSSWPYLYANLGGHYAEQEKNAQARDTFAFAIATKPKSAALQSILWFNLGAAEAKLGNQERATSAFRIAVEVDPSNVLARAGIAEIERQRGNLAVSIELLNAALLGGGHPVSRETAGWLHYQLGLSFLQAGKADKARMQFDAARARLRDARSLERLGQAMDQLNKTVK